MTPKSDMEDRNGDIFETQLFTHSYILRVWESARGTFKGYIIDPHSGETFPMSKIRRKINMNKMMGVFIRQNNCWILFGNPNKKEEQYKSNK